MLKTILVAVGQILVVGLPSWFVLFWTVDAALVPGADVFLITLVQILFLVIFIAWIRWRVAKRGQAVVESTEMEQARPD